MITLTERAADQVRRFMQEHQEADLSRHGLRLRVIGGGCAGFRHELELDARASSQDQTFEHRGIRIFVDQASFAYVDGTEIDYVETAEGAGFRICNPNAPDACGCGSSFRS